MRALLVAVAVLLLSGCAVDPFAGSSSEDSGSGTAAPSALPTHLEVTVWPNGEGDPVFRHVLECDPAAGNHPLPEDACAALRANPSALAPVRADMSCTQEYGGPDRARVDGVLDGQAVTAQFGRSNGCEIARWDALAPLFKIVVGG